MATTIPLAVFTVLALVYAVFATRDYQQHQRQWTIRGKLYRRLAITFGCIVILQLVLAVR